MWRSTAATAIGATGAPLVIWRPISSRPTDFTAIGVCVTDSDQPPPLNAIRCVPRKWLRTTSLHAGVLWNAPTKRGQESKGIRLSLATSMRLLAATSRDEESHAEFRAISFTLVRDDIKSAKKGSSGHGNDDILNQDTRPFHDSLSAEGGEDLLSGDSTLSALPTPPSDSRIPRLVPRKPTSKGWF